MSSKKSSGWILFTAKRYLLRRSSRRFMSSRFTVAGLIAGFIAICVIIGIMNGLQEGFLNDIIELESFHVIAQVEDEYDSAAIQREISDFEEVESAVLFFDVKAMMQTYADQYHPLIIRGIESKFLSDDQGFIERSGLSEPFSDFSDDYSILISRYLLRMASGEKDAVNITMMGSGRTVRHVPLQLSPEISATFLSKSSQINTSLAFMPLDTVMKANRDREPAVGIKLIDEDDLQSVATQIDQITGISSVETWKERNQAFYSALMLEKYGMMVLLSLIFLVVIINSKVSFEKYVFHKKEEIGILRSLGASKQAVAAIFQIQGAVITIIGITAGIILGVLTASYINEIIHGVQYLLNSVLGLNLSLLVYNLPVSIHIGEILVLAVVVLILSLIHIHLAVRVMIQKDPLEILRYE
jgi:lipoprotein-releasing system permease protein